MVAPIMIAFCLAFILSAAPPYLSSYVDTRRGSDSTFEYSRGNTFPATVRPFGFNLWTPITETNSRAWLYNYKGGTLHAFSVGHQPSPWLGDYGTLHIWPMVGPLQTDAHARSVVFEHANEVAQAHAYSVTMANGITVRIAPTDHAASMLMIFPQATEAHIYFGNIAGATGHIDIDEHTGTISGLCTLNGPPFYFFVRPRHQVMRTQGHATDAFGAWIDFATDANQQVQLDIGTSWISVAQAQQNLAAEIGHKTWQQVSDEGARAWDEVLGKITITTNSDADKVTFYSNMYRAHIYPTSRWEWVAGKSQYMSPFSNQVRPGKMWVNNGFWDTYRAVWPLLYLLAPERAGEMLEGFVNAYKEAGWVPQWSAPGYNDVMVGTHSDIIFADAYSKGLRNFDYAAAYASAVKNATVFAPFVDRGRKANHVTPFVGYIPADTLPQSAAWYLEDRINDFGIARMAQTLGTPSEAAYFRSRSLNYVNLFAPTVGFFRGRNGDGTWRTPDTMFHPDMWGYEFTEGCAWHYALAAAHDPRGMANLYGGTAAMGRKIDALLAASRKYHPGSFGNPIHEMHEAYDTNMGQYAHANEPMHHALYMYNYAGTPAKTQARVRAVLDANNGIYTSGIGNGGGYLGDEDNGQMSAWYIFSALGFYPAAPGHAEYAIGSPLFTRAVMHLAGHKTFTVAAPNNSATNVYIQSAQLNGKPHTHNYLTHAQIIAGGTLELSMGPTPSEWGTAVADRPASITQDDAVPLPLRDMTAASSATSSAGTAQLAIDDNSLSAWASGAAPTWLRFALPQACPLRLYTITSADSPAIADPTAWKMQGSQDGNAWVTLDDRAEQVFTWRQQTRVFPVKSTNPYKYYQVTFVTPAGGMRVSEIELLSDCDFAGK